jgi:hypothetical protein
LSIIGSMVALVGLIVFIRFLWEYPLTEKGA